MNSDSFPSREAAPVAFVEDKRPDPARIARLLEVSAAANHWANFGPLVERLSVRIGAVAKLPRGRVAVPAANGTAAMAAAAAIAETLAGRRLRWVVSAFGFHASWIGPFADSLILDCRPDGGFDLDGLARVPDDAYDAVLATNVFGVLAEMAEVVAFARARGKFLLIDGAAGLVGFDRSDHDGVIETLSFHHTKPHGFGEGGALILDAGLVDLARRVMNFGVGVSPRSGARAFANGKMSDVAAAYILDRLATIDDWAPLYRYQAARLAEIGRQLGLREAPHGRNIAAVPNYVGLELPQPRHLRRLEDLLGDVVIPRKYYVPPSGDFPNAQAIYEHILCLPCHPGLAALGDATIRELLARAIAGDRPVR